ncbi:alpha/beta hydrolase [Pseudoalteromonas sp. NBT06-2]|uniref:PGAP1-like alpha/beta domain-containing protein n=1 Tax=Pseudoalteromonas sp. NBT06-2 TaxID=2025950 RepID=UPI0025732936|nr:alpha/beta hydrolase [Pseudoalteromonas sp. NBT06-2]
MNIHKVIQHEVSEVLDIQVIVLHGLYMSGFVMKPLCHRLAKSGINILNLTYKSRDPDSQQIFKQLDDFILDKPTVLVCHSLGGLIARAYLEQNSVSSQFVTKVITLGTPHKGSCIAKQMHEKGLDKLLKNSVEYLLSPNNYWPFKAKLYSIAGDLPLGLMPIIERGSESDGTVLLDETKLKGMAEHKVFHLSHTSLIYSRQVVSYIQGILLAE